MQPGVKNPVRPSLPHPKIWMFDRAAQFKKHPYQETFKALLLLPILLYPFIYLWPFIKNPPYLAALFLTIAPFIFIEALRCYARRSASLTLFFTFILFFYVTKPLLFPPSPESALFNARFFMFENYNARIAYGDGSNDSNFFAAELKKIFPLGAKKEDVEEALVKSGQAWAERTSDVSGRTKEEFMDQMLGKKGKVQLKQNATTSTHMTYSYKGQWSLWNPIMGATWFVNAEYDAKGELTAITGRYGFTSF